MLKKRLNRLWTFLVLFVFIMQEAGYPQIQGITTIKITAIITASIEDNSPTIGSPVVADLDSDGVLEVIYVKGTSVYALERNSDLKDGWPVSFSGEAVSELAVGDLDGDGALEVVVGVKADDAVISSVYAWHTGGDSVSGYPVTPGYSPENIVIGDVSGGFEEEVIYIKDSRLALADLDTDGKQEIIGIKPDKLYILDGDMSELISESYDFVSVSNPVAGDVDNDGNFEIFFSVNDGNVSSMLYGYRYTSGKLSLLSGFPADLDGLYSASRNYLSLADIDGDDIPEVLTGSSNGYIAAYDVNGNNIFKVQPDTGAVYAPVVADVDGNSTMEIIAGSSSGSLYCYDASGNPVSISGWPGSYGMALAPGVVLVDVEEDKQDDSGAMELLLSAQEVLYAVDLPGVFSPAKIQWGMHGFNNRNINNWQSDYSIDNWSVFDNEPEGAKISCVYDWNRGSRVVEFSGNSLSNGYAFMDSDGSYINSKNTQLQWSMRFSEEFVIYVSVDTIKGRRYLVYTAVDTNMLKDIDSSGRYIHHGLGSSVEDGKWHTFSRSLVDDLQDAEADNEIVDVNAFYIQGNGRIDDVMFLSGSPATSLTNHALDAEVDVSTNDTDKDNVNDGDPSSVWTSDPESGPWVEYTWDEAIDKINKISIENVSGATGGTIYIIHSDLSVEVVDFEIDSDSVDVVFDETGDVISVIVVFDTGGGSVSVGEIGVYYDPNYEDDTLIDEYSVEDYIQIKDGYFFNPVMNTPWIPHGVAYYTWSLTELQDDLDMMAGAGVDAINVDFVWGDIETADDDFGFDNYDLLLEEAEGRGIKVFVVLDYIYPPGWAPSEWYSQHPPDSSYSSEAISFENEDVREEISEFLQKVAERYSVGGEREDLSATVAGWILANGLSYIDKHSLEYEGYDDSSVTAFSEWFKERYSDDVDMPYSYDRDSAGWYALVQWREDSIAGLVAFAAEAVRAVDTGHLISYAALGMQFGEADWQYQAEDPKKIVEACSNNGVPLDFWSIDNYPTGLENNELITGKWGIVRARHDTGLPVLVTETGFSTTETEYSIDEERQAVLLRNTLWEAIETGAIGVCVYHWDDRDSPDLTEREKGFGIVNKKAYSTIKEVFNKMDELSINELMPQFVDPTPSIAFLWDDAVDSIINRYQVEMGQLFGGLKRLGFNPGFINEDELLNGDYLDYKAIVLPRNQKMFKEVLDLLSTIAISGVKIHVNTDLPGIMDEYGDSRETDTEWLGMIGDLFGIDTVLSSYGYYETDSYEINYSSKQLYSPILSFDASVGMWKYWDRIAAGNGIVLGRFDSDNGNPSLITNDYTGDIAYDTAISLFSLGDNDTTTWTWNNRYEWLKLIYKDTEYGFGLSPDIEISGSSLILVDYRMDNNNSMMLLGLTNYSSETTETVSVTSSFIAGKAIVDLINTTVLEESSSGIVTQEIEPGGHELLLVYKSEDDGAAYSVSAEDGDISSAVSADFAVSADSADSAESMDTDSGSSDTSDSSSTESSESTSSSSDSSSSSSDTDSSTSDEESGDEDESDSPTYVGDIIIVGGAGLSSTSKEKEGPEETTVVASVDTGSYPSIRTYVGSGYTEEKITETKEESPIEQFREAVESIESETPGVIKAESKKITIKEVEETLQKESQEIPEWIKKLSYFIVKFINFFNSENLRRLIQK